MAKLFDISDWPEQSWYNTGGTRNKKVYLNPADGELYYFKQSFKKGKRDYKYEFWSEIIASEVGKTLEFDVLDYHIALRGDVVGCICKSMIREGEELVEGGKYLQAYDNTFKPEDIKQRHQYTLTLILKALYSFDKEKHYKELAETIVFDAIIGNSDRHQENWAIINTHTTLTEGIAHLERGLEAGKIEGLPKLIVNIFNDFFTEKGQMRRELKTARLLMPKQTRFAPIYDSGCSFGRELDDTRVKSMLLNDAEIEKYVSKGLAEIHWGESKISHFELISRLLEDSDLRNHVKEALIRTLNLFDQKRIEDIVCSIDQPLKDMGNPNILPIERKELVVKLLTLRIEKLRIIHSQTT
jgi:hypothetical protein